MCREKFCLSLAGGDFFALLDNKIIITKNIKLLDEVKDILPHFESKEPLDSEIRIIEEIFDFNGVYILGNEEFQKIKSERARFTWALHPDLYKFYRKH
jgi:hypothetical protein